MLYVAHNLFRPGDYAGGAGVQSDGRRATRSARSTPAGRGSTDDLQLRGHVEPVSSVRLGRWSMNVQTTSLLEIIETLPDNSTLLLHEVSWAEYEDLLALLPDNPRFRLSYDQGTLEIITLSPRHERLKSLFMPLLTVLTEEQNLNLVGLGSTTFRLPEAARGLEPDDCYYIPQAERMAGQDTIDLATDPPPDLVVEVDITHPSLDKFPIYASLRVPEVWRHDGDTL